MEDSHVLLFKYSAVSKQFERYHAIVIGTHDRDEHGEPLLHLVFFKHDEPNAHHALQGVDWADTFERVLDVPHKSDLGNQSFITRKIKIEILDGYRASAEIFGAVNARC